VLVLVTNKIQVYVKLFNRNHCYKYTWLSLCWLHMCLRSSINCVNGVPLNT